MKRFGTLLIVAILGLVLACGSGEEKKATAKSESPPGKAEKLAPQASKTALVPPYVGPIEKITLNNNYFRQVLFTGKHAQLTVMCLQPGEEIGNEMHQNVDQFFRIEGGNAKFIFGNKEERLVGDGDAVVVPAGTYHNVINMSPVKPLKLYTIYSPPIHPEGTVHKTKAEAEAAEHH
jgi:mannose-6-phosphate isomerase-like protein (cupin superfamily)